MVFANRPVLHHLKFWDEDDYEYDYWDRIAHAWTSIISAGKRNSRRLSTSSFFENVAVAENGGNKLSNVRRFIILLSGKGLTSFTINNRTNFFGEKNKSKLSRVSFFENKSLVLVLVFVLKSEAI